MDKDWLAFSERPANLLLPFCDLKHLASPPLPVHFCFISVSVLTVRLRASAVMLIRPLVDTSSREPVISRMSEMCAYICDSARPRPVTVLDGLSLS